MPCQNNLKKIAKYGMIILSVTFEILVYDKNKLV